ncbi:MAG: polymerase sigma factor SigF [Actinomycetota bacterium]|jgi:RNA polymerase sigma-B factor
MVGTMAGVSVVDQAVPGSRQLRRRAVRCRGETELFRLLAAGDVDDDSRCRIRDELVQRFAGLAVHIARRFRRPNVHPDDLEQVAMFALVRAVERFDPDHGASFTSFAGRTIEGEIKRHFRDHTWMVRVPRGAKDLHLAVRRAIDELSRTTGKEPTTSEVAAHLGVDGEQVGVGLGAGSAYAVQSLDETDRSDVPIRSADSAIEHCLDRHLVDELLDRLPARQRRIVHLRFFEDRSQSEIAAEVGLSQMHVSRLLRASFEQMRADLATCPV